MVGNSAGEFRYWAFLSYSHKDALAARTLHRRLETYRIPARLAGIGTALGRVPDRLWPIFRDREELPAATDLSETVRRALDESGALIILCSPEAAQSLWVGEEIRTFRSLHPDRPILAAILSGSPPECFPAELRRVDAQGLSHEPLATDLRPGGDGPQLGLLKLIAGTTGLGLDDLVQRDAARRIRRVTAVTVGALVAMLMMAALTVIALNARAEAERQRAEAEGLVEFMLTDLRDKLSDVGRLDIMEAVNSRALRYYLNGADVATLADESLARQARVLQLIGDDSLTVERFDAALSAYGQARAITAERLSRAPEDPARIFDHAKSDLGTGRVYEELRNWSVAQRYYQDFASAADTLLATDPNNPDYLMKAASSAIDLGNIRLNGTRDYGGAEASYERAVALFARAARARPGDMHILLAQANAYGWLADSFYMREMWCPSLRYRLRQNAVVEPLHRRLRNNSDVTFRLAAAKRGLAHSYLRVGDRRLARSFLISAQQMIAELTDQDPRNAEWQTLHRLLDSDFERLSSDSPIVTTQNPCALRPAARGR